ncbi:MAG: DUF4136 domain-containing protein [Bdellovibrionia bacterium]
MGSIVGCSSIQVASQKDPNANLAGLRTFDFVPSPSDQSVHSIANTQIKNSVTSNLDKIGVTPASPAERPDFLIAYNTSVFNIVNANQSSVGVGFGVVPGIGIGASTPVGSASTEQRGNLTLSFIDPQKNAEIWRSTATASLDGSNRDVEKIQIAVQKMIGEFKDARDHGNQAS